ncbi:histidinol-phosphatase HisJ [Pseudalkalibacillus berkeleyi]|uniref:Histidinol-phosphatase n=1 Tax=Pseudalkalibacillus berkeleyi TaxID=1069813 RepID=A0ABS9H2V2_9BACL|nr:histidinol-phosphatase HisJ [Pseudalkalibacillus berkeleyi]MCF6138239.1 histidinol-phosphatase HisJ [Pseudalkalibacillus berkeleyi]
MNIYDGHVHTPYCPHGSKDEFRAYVEQAIQLGMSGLTFTEHAPLPDGFIDPTPEKDSGMELQSLESYITQIENLKCEYKDDLVIRTGLEVDYIEGFEQETHRFLDQFGPYLDDSILSVHFLKTPSGYHCMDYSPDVFGHLLTVLGSVEALYALYYRTLHKSIEAKLGQYKPKRIGHISLVMKFQHKYPNRHLAKKEILQTLDQIANQKLQLDYNSSGVMKPLCREPYPPDWIIEEAMKREVQLVYGSDAHRAKDLGQGFEQLKKEAPLSQP